MKKKRIFTALLACCLSAPLLAAAHPGAPQNDDDETGQPQHRARVVTNGFFSNWFVQGGVQWNDADSWRPVQVAVGLGKWFAPTIGTRLSIGEFWGEGREPRYDDYLASSGPAPKAEVHFNCVSLSGDVLLNLTNVIMGYQEERVWNLISFCGPAIVRNCSFNTYSLGFGYGLLNTFRLTSRLSAHAEVGWQRAEKHFRPYSDYDASWGGHQRRFYGEVGLTIALGKTRGWKKAPDVEAIRQSYQTEIDALNAQLDDANAEIERLSQGEQP